MSTERYRTVVSPGEAAFRVRGSRFIGSIQHAATVEQADATIDEFATAHPDATHVVPAYRIRVDPFREYASDDGEPSGSAGPPMLSILQGENLENVVAVVVRYYGGTNLGVGGLVRAYGNALRRALENAVVDERRPRSRLVITASYDDSGTVRSILESSDATFEGTYEADVTFVADVPIDAVAELRDRLMSATSGRVSIEESG